MSVSTALNIATDSPASTRALAAALGRVAAAGDRVNLRGDLGAGKTEFTKGFAVGLGVDSVVNSPSFTLMAEYRGRLPLFHLDLYRLEGPEDVLAAGLLDERQAAGVTVIEWAERLGERAGDADVDVLITAAGDDARLVMLRGAGARYLAAARRWMERTG